MKQIPLLQGRALLVELPEGAANPEIFGRSLTFDTPEADEWGYDYQAVKLPEGNWRIIGMLSELWEGEVSHIFSFNERMTDVESLESAILAEGYTFQSTPKPENKDFYWGYLDDLAKWEAAQSRVLCRERSLLLGRESKTPEFMGFKIERK